MFDSFVLLIVLISIFGSLYYVFKKTSNARGIQSSHNIGKVVASFPISYKTSGFIIRIENKYYLCAENCGIIEIEYSNSMENLIANNTFQNILAKEFEKIKGFGFKKDSLGEKKDNN
ncbi:hypothetical protein ACSW8S_18260 (plasmid) [Clostridium perfringens]